MTAWARAIPPWSVLAVITGKRVYMLHARPWPTASPTRSTAQRKARSIENDGKGVVSSPSAILQPRHALVCSFMPGGPSLPGPQFRVFRSTSLSSDTATYASLVAYPPAFFAQGIARVTWHQGSRSSHR